MRLACALILLTFPAVAQNQCGPVAEMLTGLAQTYGETPRVRALTTQGVLFVIAVSPSGGWTSLAVGADGSACILAAGEAFEVAPPGDDS